MGQKNVSTSSLISATQREIKSWEFIDTELQISTAYAATAIQGYSNEIDISRF